MKISAETIEILSNFAKINDSILIQEGHEFFTKKSDKSIIGIASVPENFPQEMGIYTLSNLLNYFKIAGDEPEIEANEEYLNISGNGTKIKYKLADKEMLDYQAEEPKIDETPFATIELTEEALSTINTAKNIGATKADTVEFSCEGLEFSVKIYNDENSATNVVTKELEGESSEQLEFSIKFKDDQFPMIVQDYDLELYERIVGDHSVFFARFKSELVDYVMPAKAQAGCYKKEYA